MASPYFPSTAASRFFSAPPGTHNVTMGYLWDQDAVMSGSTASSMRTGAWRAITPEDFSDINISGVNISVGAVAVTGSPTVVVTAPIVISGMVGAVVPVSGVTQSNITNVIPVPVSGSVVSVGATYTPNFFNIVATGQQIIPATAKAWSVTVVTGAAWVDGMGPLLAGTSLAGGNYDIRSTLSRTIAVGGTGTLGTPASMPNILVVWET